MPILDTNGGIFPEGHYTFRVSDVPTEETVKQQYQAWRWTFEADTDEGVRTYSERFMVWLLAPLLRALQFTEHTPGRFDFEPTEAMGRKVTATIKHVTLDKGASAGKTVARMVDIEPVKTNGSEPIRAAIEMQSPGGKKVKKEEEIPF